MHTRVFHGYQTPTPCVQPMHGQPHILQPLLPAGRHSTSSLQHSSTCRHQQPTPAHLLIAHASKPDRGSVAALEAAIGAINGILGAHNRSRQKKQQQKGSKQQQSPADSSRPVTGSATGPSKLVSFSAKASGSVPVKEWYKIPQEPTQQTNPTRNGSSSSSSSSSKVSRSRASPAPPPPAAAEWPRSLQAYLSLPLEQYSVLDPSLITRLPPGTDTELLLTKLLAARKERKAARQQQQQQQQVAAAAAASGSNGSNGTSLEPQMRQLQEAAAGAEGQPADASSSNGSSNGAVNEHSAAAPNSSSSSSSIGHSSSPPPAQVTAVPEAAAAAAAAAADEGSPTAAAAGIDAGAAGGSFLLRIPMEELIGVALEPLLIVTVDIDTTQGQVKFRASRLVVGDERFDAEFKVDLQAVMSSKVTKQPHIVHTGPDNSNSSSSAAGSSSSSSNGSSSGQPDGAAVAVQAAAAAATAVAEATAVGSQEATGSTEQQQQQEPLYWQRSSALSCRVNLSMTLRLPHPLSIVPGPLLATTASLVAKLVMQSLLPSFLELLSTDYGRWASGSSRAAPVGSLVAAGKQHLKQQKQQKQAASSS